VAGLLDFADRRPEFGGDAPPGAPVPQVEGQIVRERGIETAIVAASADRLDLAARHGAKKAGLAASPDPENDFRRAVPGRQSCGLGNRTIKNALKFGESGERPAILAANRRANGCL
jgi:hypothetical protein